MLEQDLRVDHEKLKREMAELTDLEIHKKIEDAEFYIKKYKETAWNHISDRTIKEKAIKLLFLSKAFIKVGNELLQERSIFKQSD